jgi:hypothetical protein
MDDGELRIARGHGTARKFIFPTVKFASSLVTMSTVQEIEAAIETLPERQRQRLESWFIAQRFGDDAALERELAVAIREANSSPRGGKSPEEVRALIRRWISKSGSKNAH